jgi:uncharacterized protein (DUF2126 family)
MNIQELNACGEFIDNKLEAFDARLTMGSEPTFTSKKYVGSPEWNINALGREKLNLAKKLSQKLLARIAPGAIILHAKGKWCEGELVPRWSYNTYWLKNNTPLWKNANLLIIDPLKAPSCSFEQMKTFMVTLASNLEIKEKFILSANENNISTIMHQHLKKPTQHRDVIIEQLTKSKPSFAGFVLPLYWEQTNHQWRGLQWNTANHQLLLHGFGLPIGFRLPHTPHQLQERALCVELHHQRLYVFLPKLDTLEAYLHILSCIERTAQQLNQMVALTGYEPPSDSHFLSLKITPDPGVLEVNMPPAASWSELVSNNQMLYEEADALGLTTKKFLANGRPVSTGGGHHILIGSMTPSECIVFRNPGVLRSLITYWQHHPSLAYLFSDQFVGPTSQAPRMDEVRSDNLNEIEVELMQLTKHRDLKPCLISHGLAYMLTDIIGNAHRAEICLDKLALKSDHAALQGLIELRAFAMPPTVELCLLQLLLVRALIAYFCEHPYHQPLMRWGDKLHQQFFLPTFIWQDFCQIIAGLNQKGYMLDLSWFKPLYEHRFPVIGQTEIKGMSFTLRTALECWPVIGKDLSSGACGRIVDVALERIEMKASHFDAERYMITCNNIAIPLHHMDTGEHIAGIRFKKRDLPMTLHPTVPVQHQLEFNVIDTLEKYTVGGFSYTMLPDDNVKVPQTDEEAMAFRQKCFKSHGRGNGADYIQSKDMNHQDFIFDFCRCDARTPTN